MKNTIKYLSAGIALAIVLFASIQMSAAMHFGSTQPQTPHFPRPQTQGTTFTFGSLAQPQSKTSKPTAFTLPTALTFPQPQPQVLPTQQPEQLVQLQIKALETRIENIATKVNEISELYGSTIKMLNEKLNKITEKYGQTITNILQELAVLSSK